MTPGFTPLNTPAPAPTTSFNVAPANAAAGKVGGAIGDVAGTMGQGFNNIASTLGNVKFGQPQAPATPTPILKTVPINFAPTTNPTLSTPFTGPATGKITAPAVHTSGAAEDNIDHLATTSNAASADTANLNAVKAGIVAPPGATTTPGTTTPPSGTETPGGGSSPDAGSGGNDLGSQINNILSGLDTAEGSTAQPDPGQQAQLDELNSSLGFDQTTLAQVGGALDSMANGTFPLTPAEQSQVNDVKSSYMNALNSAQRYAQNVIGGMTAKNAAFGLQQYSPALALSNMHSAIIQGGDKVSAVNTRISSSMTKLTTALQNADYKQANSLYNNISKDITTRQNEIDKINTSLQHETDKMHSDALSVARLQISTLTNNAKFDEGSFYKAQNLILSEMRLSDSERKTALDELNKSNTARTVSERTAQALSAFQSAFTEGSKMPDGTPILDDNGYATPTAWQAAIKDAPAEGMSRADFIKGMAQYIYAPGGKLTSDQAKAYGLYPAEIKLVTGALATQ